MPFSYSISKGIALGVIAYVFSKVFGKKAKEVSIVTWILAVVFVAYFVFEAVK